MAKIVIGETIRGFSFAVDADALVMGRTFICSVSRYGKSWTNRRLCEQLIGKAGIVIIDPEGEYSSLREKFPLLIIGKDVPLQVETAEFLAETVLKENLSVIIDLSLVDEDVGKQFVALFIDRFMLLETTARKPYLFVIEEIDELAPERGVGKAISTDSIRNMAKKGGKRGIGMIVTAHRPAWVLKGVLSQCTTLKLIGRIEWNSDLDVLQEFLQISPSILRRPRDKEQNPIEDGKLHIESLEPGQFYITGTAAPEDTFVKVGTVLTTHLGCYTGDVKIFTPNGLKNYQECREGDFVWSLNSFGFMEAKPITKIYVYDYSGPIFQIKGKRVNNSVTPNNRMLMKTRQKPLLKYEEAKFCFNRYEFYVPITAKWEGSISPIEDLVPSCVEGRSQHLSNIDLGDLLEIAGWYLAEGFPTKDGCNTNNMVQFCSPITDKKRVHLENLLSNIGLTFNLRSDSIRVYCKRLCKFLEQFGKGAHNKHIPAKFLQLPTDLLNRLFKGLTAGDGWNHISGATKGLPYGYSTVSNKLSENIAELALKIGLQPRLKPREPREHAFNNRIIRGGNSWEIYFVRNAKGHIRIKDNVTMENYNGKVWCFEIADNGNMLVFQNGTFMFCGNSTPGLIPPTPKELVIVLKHLNEALPKIIQEKIKPTTESIEEAKKVMGQQLEEKYAKQFEKAKTKLEKEVQGTITDLKNQITDLKGRLESVSRDAVLTTTTPIKDALEHPIVKTTMLKLDPSARQLLIRIHQNPDQTREQLAAFLSASRDKIANTIQRINTIFKAEVILGKGKPIKYKSALNRLFITEVARREISELERLSGENETLKQDKENLISTNRAQLSQIQSLTSQLKNSPKPETVTALQKDLSTARAANKTLTESNKDALQKLAKANNLFKNIQKVISESQTTFQPPSLAPVSPISVEVPVEAPEITSEETVKEITEVSTSIPSTEGIDFTLRETMLNFLSKNVGKFFSQRELALTCGANVHDKKFQATFNSLKDFPGIECDAEKGVRIK